MEQESQQPLVGMLGCDRDLFSRVWARVSPGDGEGCPILVLPPEEARAVPAVTAAPVAGAVPTMVNPPVSGDRPGNDDPGPGDVPCLGNGGADHNALLQEYIRLAMTDWRTYQALARRAGGATGRTLGALAADKRRQAKRLSAAYFLISGVRFLPEVPMARPGGSLLGIIRERFWAEQRGAAAYLAAAEETADQCLASLYRDLAAESAAHADLLRSLVEHM